MPWKEHSRVSLREEFVELAKAEGVNLSELCRRFKISRKTGYKWLARHSQDPEARLTDRSRRPLRSPRKTAAKIELQVVDLRQKHSAWGGRKLRARLLALKVRGVPAASTITDILRRHELIDHEESIKHAPFIRFQQEHPNDLWQMDFKGQFRLVRAGWCFPLTVLDDCSRFALGLRACGDQKAQTVRQQLIELFRRYGLPRRILTDNGSPWGCDGEHKFTIFSAWLIRLGVSVSHGRPYHPQTQGKDERFHRTLQAEVLRGRSFLDCSDAQRSFDPWRDVYNCERPHEALSMTVPASRYRPSGRAYPESLPPIEYGPQDIIRHVSSDGYFQFQKRKFKVSQAFTGQPIALRATTATDVFDVFYCHQRISQISLCG